MQPNKKVHETKKQITVKVIKLKYMYSFSQCKNLNSSCACADVFDMLVV